ncbi:LysR substrate-binding domain-containing protein [Acuticoccus sp. I52.16.1]|uniref:LysR substrate-binding domain-containing protein n=1 Tax=Acuticoccus sp. I52.16.1 TaxID=2928472 RepID=UPI001FD073BC|nr:LysR substrate-binding domain-containing protein [Acuticoccus sp. I52.16.1]UOM34186.1 LysR substrate-binding domain-containing protein [Acuticoccus sp. I52.16.1]
MMRLLRIRDLEYFIAIAENGSFSRAAQACGISQPTLSAQVRRMEDLLGVTLLERRHGHTSITTEGAEVLAAAREIMDAFHRVQRTTKGDGVLLGRPMRFGILPTVAPYLAPHFLTTVAELSENSDITFVEDRTDQLEAGVASDHLDFAITATLPRANALTALPLGDERLVVVSRHPLPETVSLDGLNGPLLLMQEGHCFREVVSEAIRRAQLRFEPAMSTRIGPSSFATLVSLVRAGVGDTILPEPYARQSAEAVAGLSVALMEPLSEGRQLHFVVRAGRERYRDVTRLVEAARDAHRLVGGDIGEPAGSSALANSPFAPTL